MKHYKVYGMHIASDFEFVQLKPLQEGAEKEKTQIYILEGVVPDIYKFQKECYSQIDKKISYLSNRTCYLLAEGGEKLIYEKKGDAKDTNLNAYLLGWGIAMLCYQRGEMAIHCSCVYNEKGAVMISGTSGSGKSSVTAFLLKKGYALLADDMTVLRKEEQQEIYAAPAFPYQKLCRDAADENGVLKDKAIFIDEKKDKFLIPYEGHFSDKPVKVRAMVILGYINGNRVEYGELEGMEKVYACMGAWFLKGLLKEKMQSPEIVNQCLYLASKIPVYYILRPVETDSRNEVADILTKLI